MRKLAPVLAGLACLLAPTVAASTAAPATAPSSPPVKSDPVKAQNPVRNTNLESGKRATGTKPAPQARAPQASAVKAPAKAARPAEATKKSSAKVAARTKPARATTTLAAHIDLTRQRMSVRSGGKTIHSWKISSGARGYETPTGRFRPQWVARKWHSRKYDMAPMPYSVFFNAGIATHGTTSVRRLGRPASHGCIRLKTAHARRFYKLVRKHGMKHTRIVVTGRAKQPARRVARKNRRDRFRRSRTSTPRSVRRTNRSARRSVRQTYYFPQRRRSYSARSVQGYRGYSYFRYPAGRY